MTARDQIENVVRCFDSFSPWFLVWWSHDRPGDATRVGDKTKNLQMG